MVVKRNAKRARCNAEKRLGVQCRRDAGWGTDHMGRGRCKDHDILPATVTSQLPTPERILALADQFKKDSDPFDLREEIGMTRAAIVVLLEQADTFGSFVKGVPALNQLLNTVGRLVQRLDEIERGRKYVVRVEDVRVSLQSITAIVVQFVDDPEARAEVAKRIGGIVIDGQVMAPPAEIPERDQEALALISGEELPEVHSEV